MPNDPMSKRQLVNGVAVLTVAAGVVLTVVALIVVVVSAVTDAPPLDGIVVFAAGVVLAAVGLAMYGDPES